MNCTAKGLSGLYSFSRDENKAAAVLHFSEWTVWCKKFLSHGTSSYTS